MSAGPATSRTSATAAGEGRDRQERDADRARERGVARGRLEPGEVRQQRRLDRLKSCSGRARDEQCVEDDARRGRGRRSR
jgi:hypothetical protein